MVDKLRQVMVTWQMRTEAGGMTDDTALMTMMIVIGSLLVGAIFIKLGDAIDAWEFDVPGT